MRLSEARTALKRRRSDRSYSNAALDGFLNDARRDIESRKRWSWLRRSWSRATTAADSTSITSWGGVKGSRVASVGSGTDLPTLWGKRMVVASRTVRVVNINASGLGLTLDAPWPDASVASQTPTILYDELALPLDADTALQVVLRQSGGYGRTLRAETQGAALSWDPTTTGEPTCYCVVRREPLPPPKTGPGAANSGGGSGPAAATYLYWVSYIDKQTGAESALSPPTTYVQSGTNAVTVTPPSRRDFLARVYRSRAGGSVPYHVGDNLAYGATVLDSLTDEYLGDRAPSSATESFLRLWPVPDGIYQVEATVLVRGPDLSDDEDRPLFPATFDDVWLAGAEALMLEASDEQGRANQARARLEAGVQRMMEQDTVEGSRRLTIGGRTVFSGVGVGWPDVIQN